jgi:hypothetical protein
MKIKTITRNFGWVAEFDGLVNAAIDEGWHLVKREVIPGVAGVSDSRRLLYAELVQLDPEPEPEAQPLDPIGALHAVQEFCDAQEKCGNCQLYAWCCQLRKGGDPTDWELSWKEAPEA